MRSTTLRQEIAPQETENRSTRLTNSLCTAAKHAGTVGFVIGLIFGIAELCKAPIQDSLIVGVPSFCAAVTFVCSAIKEYFHPGRDHDTAMQQQHNQVIEQIERKINKTTEELEKNLEHKLEEEEKSICHIKEVIETKIEQKFNIIQNTLLKIPEPLTADKPHRLSLEINNINDNYLSRSLSMNLPEKKNPETPIHQDIQKERRFSLHKSKHRLQIITDANKLEKTLNFSPVNQS